MPPIIQVEHVSKQYRLGEVGTGTLSHDLKRWWYRARGKEDPYARIGEVNDRSTKGNSDYVWALQDINFTVQPGEVLGIIGRNGAGKSTLLKILSKTTAPTTGKIKVRGRIASLLEVGTGFHPELTGRENIYLNGAILGMTRKEISRKFDEIVDFAGVERYVDTPVKRYSSGMYVRLAFAVAAHLEPEILIVDEVLAVGDAEFQKKCLGKMKDVSVNEGRTVLFVSHDLSAIKKLCNNLIVLDKGKIENIDKVTVGISKYLSLKRDTSLDVKISGSREVFVNDIVFKNNNDEVIDDIQFNQPLTIELHCTSIFDFKNIQFAICFNNLHDVRITSLWSAFNGESFNVTAGKFIVEFKMPSIKFIIGTYKIITYINSGNHNIETVENIKEVNIIESDKKNMDVVSATEAQGLYIENFKVFIKNLFHEK